MSRNLAYAAICSLVLLAYLLAGFVVQAVMDKSQWADVGGALGTSTILALAVGGLVYFLLRVFQLRASQSERQTKAPRAGQGLALTAIATIGLAAILGGWRGHARQVEVQAVAATAKAASDAERARIAALTPEQRAEAARQREAQAVAAAKAEAEKAQLAAAEVERKAKRTAQLQMAGAGAMQLKRAMKDPESFNLTSLVVKDNGTACYEYRAKNSFGAILPNSAVMTTKGKILVEKSDGNAFATVWNKECVPAGGDEIAEILRRQGVI